MNIGGDELKPASEQFMKSRCRILESLFMKLKAQFYEFAMSQLEFCAHGSYAGPLQS